MAMAKQAKDTPANYDPQMPNRMILWLDAHIGNPKEYVHLKKAFGSNTDPTCQTWTMLKDKDYDKMIDAGDAISVTFEGVEFLLQAFNNENACLEAFEQNQDKHIFFITSGSMGKGIVPKVIERYQRIFTDPITNKPYPSVYVFCLHIEYHLEWAMEYIQYVQMFTTESELLERMTRDIAEYFIEQGSRLRQGNDLKGALQRLDWAKKLWHQYDKMQQDIKTGDFRPVRVSQRMIEIDELIAEVKALILQVEASIAEAETESSDKPSNDENASSDDEGKGCEPT
jgi:hypothetical protein